MQPTRTATTRYVWLSLLRAYGVILVLGYHFFPWIMPGGFIGVDVFFVFSGYLITSLLIREFRQQGSIALLSFYKRRFRRLFPALISMLLVVLPLALTIPEDFRADLARQVAAVLSWTTNFYEISTGQSYANALLPHLFVHTWTLSIEMHYYLIWGLLLTVLIPLFVTTTAGGRKSVTLSRKVVAALAAFLALMSYIAMQVVLIGADDPSAAYYSTFTHAYPILIGSVFGALAGFGRNPLVAVFERLAPAVALILVFISLAVIALMAFLVPFESGFVYSVGLLLTSLLLGLVLLVGRGAQEALQKFPEPKLLKYIADRSYSIYLFHWPLMIIVLEWARALFGGIQIGVNAPYLISAVIGLTLTFAVSHVSYRFVEKPFFSSSKPVEAQASSSASAKMPFFAFLSSLTPLKTTLGKVATPILACILVVTSVVAISTAPLRTSIETSYKDGLLEIDFNTLIQSHQVLLYTGTGGSMNGAPGLLVRPGTITIIGDSVTILPADSLTSQTGAVVDAEVSRAMVNGVQIVRDMEANKTLGEYVVIALATNAHADSFESALTICEEIAPGHKLVFVTAHGNASMDELNAQLRTLPQLYPFVTIADWDFAIQDRYDLLAADGFHLNGQEAIDIYTNVIIQALGEAGNKPSST